MVQTARLFDTPWLIVLLRGPRTASYIIYLYNIFGTECDLKKLDAPGHERPQCSWNASVGGRTRREKEGHTHERVNLNLYVCHDLLITVDHADEKMHCNSRLEDQESARADAAAAATKLQTPRTS